MEKANVQRHSRVPGLSLGFVHLNSISFFPLFLFQYFSSGKVGSYSTVAKLRLPYITVIRSDNSIDHNGFFLFAPFQRWVGGRVKY